jgi:alanyl-tRNA synthetase
MLGGSRVIDVVENEDGDVVHLLEGPPPRVGHALHGVIDWPRRFDHMQQHTGQHVLSAAIDRKFSVRTVGFHLGAEVSTIDLARELTRAELLAAEDEANDIVWDDRPVTIKFVTSAEAAALPLRKEPVREGTLRLIAIEQFDVSACGGTHVMRTGTIGIIAVTAWERFKGGQRLEFVCGGRALARIRALRDTAAESVRLLSVGSGELPTAIARMQADLKEYRRQLADVNSELAGYKVEELAAQAEQFGDLRVTLRAVAADAASLKVMASNLAGRPRRVAVLVSSSQPALAVVSRSADVQVSASDLLKRLLSTFGGKGGGKPDLAQGGGLDARPEAILGEARQILVELSQNPT